MSGDSTAGDGDDRREATLDPHRSDEGVRVVSLSIGDTLDAWKDAIRRLRGKD